MRRFEKFGHPRATPIFAPTFNGEGVIRIGNVRQDPRYGKMSPHHGMPPGHLPVCSYLAVPVALRTGEVIGGLFQQCGQVHTQARQAGGALATHQFTREITIADSGLGISPDFLPFIFDRFRQADSSTTRSHGGLGLGLSIVKQLVELHGGSVRAESSGENLGSTFVVSLPVRVLRESESREHPRTRTPLPFQAEVVLAGIQVLVVDDDPDARELLLVVLAANQASVVSAPSADEALRLLKSTKPDVIVSDVGMPVCDGYQFMRLVRGLPPDQGGKTPPIALTAFARSEDRTRALLAGYQAHIAKPIEPHELIVTIASLTGRT